MRVPIKRSARALLWALPALLAFAAGGVGQESGLREPSREGRRLWASAQFRWTMHDNYFQAPHQQPDSMVHATAVRMQVVYDAVRTLGLQTYLDGRVTAYDAFDPTFGLGGGVRIGPRPLRVDVGAGYDLGLPRLDLGDSFARADVAQAHAEASLRLGRFLEVTGTGRAIWQALIVPEGSRGGTGPDPWETWEDFTYVEWEARARTRVLGYWLSPEVGIGRARPWNEETSPFAHRQEQWLAQIRSVPMAPAYLSVRYRERRRTYPWAPEGSSSHGRMDERAQWAVGLDLKVAESVSWNLYYAREEARSSLVTRSFRTHALSLGITVQGRR